MIQLISIIVVIIAGTPLTWALTRRLPLALLFAPLAIALAAAVATMLMLAFGGTLLLWLPITLVVQWLLAWRLQRRHDPPAPHGSWRDAALIIAPLCPPLLIAAAPPVNWDAHSIWWLHAAYFSHGAEFAREAIGNPAYAFSHPDYPPLATASLAAIWTVIDSSDFRVAQCMSTLLTVSGIAALVYAVRRVTSFGPPVVSWLAAIGVGLAVWALQPAAATSGLSDPLWATTFIAAATLLLFGRDRTEQPLLPLTLLTVAALTKNEGLVMVFALAGVLTVRDVLSHRRTGAGVPRRVALYWVPVGAGTIWALLVRLLGGTSDLANGGIIDLLTKDLAIRPRLAEIFQAYAAQFGTIITMGAAVAVLGALFLRRRRRELGIGSDLGMWCVLGFYCLILTATYLVTPHGLAWHLRTSLDRVSEPIVLMACVSAVCWAVIALAPDRGPTAAASPE